MRYIYLLLLLNLLACGPLPLPTTPQQQTGIQPPVVPSENGLLEGRIRYILVNLAKGVDISYYQNTQEKEAIEALKRWGQGIRVANAEIFERKDIAGKGFQIVYKGSQETIDGMSVTLTAADTPDEGRIRYILVDLTKGVDISYYQGLQEKEAIEALKRWEQGTRVANANIFERKDVPGKGFQIVYKGSQETIDGMSVTLTAADTPNEGRVRYILVDLTKGVDIAYYQGRQEKEAIEALKRWEQGTRVANAEIFERKDVAGKGFQIVYKGTDTTIDGMSVALTLSTSGLSEARIRYIMAELGLNVPIDYYQGLAVSDPEAAEAVTRWEQGNRVANIDIFERKQVPDKGWRVVYKGTDETINGMSVTLTTAAIGLNENRIRFILAELGLDVPIDYYRGLAVSDPEAAEAVTRWDNGVRVANIENYERKLVNGSWQIFYINTDKPIDDKSLVLTTG